MILRIYIAKRFIKILANTLASCLLIFISVDYVSNFHRFIGGNAKDVLWYYLNSIPYILYLITPITLLLTCLFCIGKMAQDNEITALKAAGIHLWRIVLPLLIIGLFISLGTLYYSEEYLPQANANREALKKKLKNIRTNQTINSKHNSYYQSKSSDVLYHFSYYSSKNNNGRDPVIYFFKNNQLSKIIVAEKMYWKGTFWQLSKGYQREWIEGKIKFNSFDFIDMDSSLIPDRPEDFAVVKKKPQEMNYRELKQYIEAARRTGTEIRKYMADLYFKISYPFVNFIVILLAIGLAAQTGRRGMSIIFGLGLFLIFFYYIILKLGIALGHTGIIEPMFSAWFGNILFFPISIGLFWKALR